MCVFEGRKINSYLKYFALFVYPFHTNTCTHCIKLILIILSKHTFLLSVNLYDWHFCTTYLLSTLIATVQQIHLQSRYTLDISKIYCAFTMSCQAWMHILACKRRKCSMAFQVFEEDHIIFMVDWYLVSRNGRRC